MSLLLLLLKSFGSGGDLERLFFMTFLLESFEKKDLFWVSGRMLTPKRSGRVARLVAALLERLILNTESIFCLKCFCEFKGGFALFIGFVFNSPFEISFGKLIPAMIEFSSLQSRISVATCEWVSRKVEGDIIC